MRKESRRSVSVCFFSSVGSALPAAVRTAVKPDLVGKRFLLRRASKNSKISMARE